MRLILIAGAVYLGWRAMQPKAAPLPSPTPTTYVQPLPAYVGSGAGGTGVPGLQLSSLSSVPITSTATA